MMLFLGVLFAKENNEKDYNPCNHPLLKLAESRGIKAVPIKDRMKLKKVMDECEDNGGGDRLVKLYESDRERDFEKAKTMASWTSTHAMIVVVSFGYYFMGKIFATKPDDN